MTRFEREQALINKKKNELSAAVTGYAKRVKGLVDAALIEEYETIIEGKVVKQKKEKKSFDFGGAK